jgi:hypothetical protein
MQNALQKMQIKYFHDKAYDTYIYYSCCSALVTAIMLKCNDQIFQYLLIYAYFDYFSQFLQRFRSGLQTELNKYILSVQSSVFSKTLVSQLGRHPFSPMAFTPFHSPSPQGTDASTGRGDAE